jgi:vacuolar-type H+-ATPase subunit E/Vma4
VTADSAVMTAEALEPLRAGLISRANAEADRIRAAAIEDGQRVLTAAREEAHALLETARAQGRADAAALVAVETARARRAGREEVLAAQQAAYDQLCEQARAAVRALLDEPGRQERLLAVIRGQLGGQAEIHLLPAGGVRAQTPDGRSIDASVAALVDRAVAGLHPEQLWTAG